MFLRAVSLLRDRVPDGGGYPWDLPVVAGLTTLELTTPVTFLVGENGSGKSTLVEAIAVALGINPEGGTSNLSFSTRDSHSSLHDALRLVRGTSRPRTRYFLRAESMFTVASHIEALDDEPLGGAKLIDSYGGRSLHEQSHGESFLALVNNRFDADGLYLLDEPESALSPHGLLALMARIADLVASGAQFLIATHSPILLALPEATDRHMAALAVGGDTGGPVTSAPADWRRTRFDIEHILDTTQVSDSETR